MSNRALDVVAQSQLTAVLRYFAHGDFSKFSSAAELVLGTPRVQEPYLCADLLLAYQIAGLCEVSNVSGVTRWWASHSGDIHLRSMCPKEIGVTPNWLSERASGAIALIANSSMSPLVLGSLGSEKSESQDSSVFDRAFVNLVPSFARSEHQLCVEVPFSDELPGSVEFFDPTAGRWSEASSQRSGRLHLIRIRGEYSGFAYFVQHSQLGIRIKITQPEWAFVVAYHVLPWSLSYIMRIDGESVRINRAVRLPTLLYRTLFAACQVAYVGPVVTFENVDPRCLRGILAYFDAVGERA